MASQCPKDIRGRNIQKRPKKCDKKTKELLITLPKFIKDKHYIINGTALFSYSFAMKSKKVYSRSIHSVSVYLCISMQMHWFAKKCGEDGEESIQYPFWPSKYWLKGLQNDIMRPTNTDITSDATKHKISKMRKNTI